MPNDFGLAQWLSSLIPSVPAPRREEVRPEPRKVSELKPAPPSDTEFDPAGRERLVRVKFNASLLTDVKHDGFYIGGAATLYTPGSSVNEVAPISPNNGKPVSEKVILVNGIMTNAHLETEDAQALANTGREVVALHNSTRGIFRDLGQCLIDAFDVGLNPPVDTLSRAFSEAIRNKKPLHVIAHSQGAVVTARALADAKNRLMLQQRLTPTQAAEAMGVLTITTIGGFGRNYVDGPKYTHVVNLFDVVPTVFGVKGPFSKPGAGAKIVTFTELNKPARMPEFDESYQQYFARFVDRTVHGPQDVYFKHLVSALRP